MSSHRHTRGSSPLSRGILLVGDLLRDEPRIIPALAGNTPNTSTRSWQCPDHPRSRGEYPASMAGMNNLLGSSPLSRGIRMTTMIKEVGDGIIPALAGNTRCPRCVPYRRSDHPRSRGEYIPWIMPPFFPGGSSPLSRGIPRPRDCGHVCAGIIPALAGNTQTGRAFGVHCQDHPRSRGEYSRSQ